MHFNGCWLTISTTSTFRLTPDAIAVLPEDGDLTGLHSMTLESSDDD